MDFVKLLRKGSGGKPIGIKEATWRSKVALSINLTGAIFVNQSAAFSDYHGTGGNPAANASYSDSAFVANRFRVVQRRYHVEN